MLLNVFFNGLTIKMRSSRSQGVMKRLKLGLFNVGASVCVLQQVALKDNLSMTICILNVVILKAVEEMLTSHLH